MKINVQILAAGMAIAVAATPAAALVKIATFRGTIAYGTDETGAFGTAGQDLAGLSYVTTFTYDRRLGYQISDGLSDLSSGGTFYGNRSPFIDTTITINGVTKHSSGSTEGSAEISNDLSSYPYTSYQANYLLIDGVNIRSSGISGGFIGILANSLDMNVIPTIINSAGSFYFHYFDRSTDVSSVSVVASFNGGEAIYSVGDAVGGAVPEPASWAMLVTGFGIMGASLRRKRTVRLA